MSSICRPRVVVLAARGGTTGPVLDWLRISMFASPVQGSKPIGGYAIETRNPPPLFGNRPVATCTAGRGNIKRLKYHGDARGGDPDCNQRPARLGCHYRIIPAPFPHISR